MPSDVPSDTLDFLCSVETFRRPILFRPSSQSPLNGGTAEVLRSVSYSIASVFTPPANRGKKYAQTMMTLLHDELRMEDNGSGLVVEEEDAEVGLEAAKGGKDGVVSFLYSDVGDFYSRAKEARSRKGWRIVGTERTTTWDLRSLTSSTPTTPQGFEAVPITTESLPSLANRDANLLRASLYSSPSVAHDRFIVEPTPGSFIWSTSRSTHSFTSRNLSPPHTWGFELRPTGAATSDQWSFILLSFLAHTKGVEVLRLRLATDEQTGEPLPGHATFLLNSAARLAQELGSEKVVGWNVHPSALDELGEKGVGKGVTEERKDHLSALAWYGPTTVDGGEPEVAWLVNETYAWC